MLCILPWLATRTLLSPLCSSPSFFSSVFLFCFHSCLVNLNRIIVIIIPPSKLCYLFHFRTVKMEMISTVLLVSIGHCPICFDFIHLPIVLKSSTNCPTSCNFVCLWHYWYRTCVLSSLLCVPSSTWVLFVFILCLTFVDMSPGVSDCFLPFSSARRTQANAIPVSSMFFSSWLVFLTIYYYLFFL